MDTFPYGMIKSKHSTLIEGLDFWFVSDYWTTTRYSKNAEGLKEAQNHILFNKRIDSQRFKNG